MLNKQRIDARDEIGVTSFTDDAKSVLDLCCIGQRKTQIITTLQSLRAHGGTDLKAPLQMRLDSFAWDRTDVVRRIVMLTDGHGGNPHHVAEALRRRGVVIDVIAIGPSPSEVNESLLHSIASTDRYRFVKDQRTLVQHYTQLAHKTSTSAK